MSASSTLARDREREKEIEKEGWGKINREREIEREKQCLPVDARGVLVLGDVAALARL